SQVLSFQTRSGSYSQLKPFALKRYNKTQQKPNMPPPQTTQLSSINNIAPQNFKNPALKPC
ncbi:TPA: hypothetical protein ACG5VD_005140, partial [Escherichia coli]